MESRTTITNPEEKLDTPETQYRHAAQSWKSLEDKLEEKAKQIAVPEKTSGPIDESYINECIALCKESINNYDQIFPYLSKAAEKGHIKATQFYTILLVVKILLKDLIEHMEAMK